MPPSSSVRYIETNSLWAIATGRDPDAIRLLKNPPLDLCLALPQVCVMEAFSVLNATRRQKNQFRNSLDRQISEMRRDATSPSLILHCILAHARSASFTAKILLTENRKDFDSELVRTECAKVGLVSFFNRTEPFLKWLGFQPPS